MVAGMIGFAQGAAFEGHLRSVASRISHPLLAAWIILLEPTAASHASSVSSAPIQSDVSVSSPTLVFNTGISGCDNQDTPDAPARAFRDAHGLTHLFAAGSVNRAMIGRDLGHLKRSCHVVYQGQANGPVSSYDNHGWLAAFWATDDHVDALIHNEYHGIDTPTPCGTGDRAGCTDVSITGAISGDGGLSFKRVSGDAGLVATLPYVFDPRPGSFVGLTNPSNIVQHDGFFYVLISQIDADNERKSGVCVFRTKNLDRPDTWRGWDGTTFSVAAFNPYDQTRPRAASDLCQPIAREQLFFSLGSLMWDVARQRFLLVERLQAWDKRPPYKPGAYIFWSKDLLRWSTPTLLLSDAAAGAEQLYPSLIDPNALDQNFSSVGVHPTLYSITVGYGPKTSTWSLWSRAVSIKAVD